MNLHFAGTGAAAAQDDRVKVLRAGGTQLGTLYAELFIRPFTLACFQGQQRDLPGSGAPSSCQRCFL